ncbi:hypothetical protein FOA52_012056 [Chlamydomonas sp. UWO 241]|nr:hypothetical protein FOA52_012056 [Chlamydomonas sp. UWO 241]
MLKSLLNKGEGASTSGANAASADVDSVRKAGARSFTAGLGLRKSKEVGSSTVTASAVAASALSASACARSNSNVIMQRAPTPPLAAPPAVPAADEAAQAKQPTTGALMRAASTAQLRSRGASVLLSVAPVLPTKMSRATWCLKDYAIVEKMYTGYASNVYKAWCKHSSETVCLKVYKLGSLCELNRYQIFREVKLHSGLQHENVITLYGAFLEDNQIVMVQEFADGGDLFSLLARHGGSMPERTSVELVLAPFLQVLNYLHQHSVVHRDIKPENVLFTRSMQLKLCDFGLAIDLREERAVTRAGTLEYMAPEVLCCPFKSTPNENKEKDSLHYNHMVDTWAVGVLTYELVVGFPPFYDKQRSAIEAKIRTEVPRFPTTMSELCRNFVLQSLQKDAVNRPTILDLLSHPWVKGLKRSSSMRALVPTPRPPSVTAAVVQVPTPAPGGDRELRTDNGDLLAMPHGPAHGSFTAGSTNANNRFKMRIAEGANAANAAKIAAPGAGSPLGMKPTSPTGPPPSPGAIASPRFGVGGGIGAHRAVGGGGGSAVATSAMSFATATNPKLQALQAEFARA